MDIYKKDEKGIPTVAMVGFDLLNLAGIAGGSPRTGHPWRAGAWEGPGPPDPISDLSQEGRYIEDAITGNSALVSLVRLGFRGEDFAVELGWIWQRFLPGRLSLFASRGVDISEQIVRIEMEVKQQPNVDALRPGSFAGSLWTNWARDGTCRKILVHPRFSRSNPHCWLKTQYFAVPVNIYHHISLFRGNRHGCWLTPHGSAGARHMAFDDLEWVSDSSFRLGDRVWAQGREATMTEWSYKKI